MSIIYSQHIMQFAVSDHDPALPKTVKSAVVQYQARDTVTEQQHSLEVEIAFDAATAETFVSFDQLTDSMVQTWLENVEGQYSLSSMHQLLALRLQEQQQQQTWSLQQVAPPWDPSCTVREGVYQNGLARPPNDTLAAQVLELQQLVQVLQQQGVAPAAAK